MIPWTPWFSLPGSGDVTQAIAPVTSWFSPTYNLSFAGDANIEADVVSNVASYGRQLGRLADVVLELAEGKDTEAVAALREIHEKIAERKTRRRGDVVREAEHALRHLAEIDEDALKRLIKRYA